MLTHCSVPPLWMDNYNRGYIGFTYSDKSFVSRGIAYFERWERYSSIPVSHVLIVTGWNQCVEALPQGVVSSPLTPYFEDPNTLIFFRKPRTYTHELGTRICESATRRIGQKYGYRLLVAHGLRGTTIGRLIDNIFFGVPHRLTAKLLDSRKQQICSELAARALREQWEFEGIGVLRRDPATISPQMLFEDESIFEPWRNIPQ